VCVIKVTNGVSLCETHGLHILHMLMLNFILIRYHLLYNQTFIYHNFDHFLDEVVLSFQLS
jgi:hypothetical protein